MIVGIVSLVLIVCCAPLGVLAGIAAVVLGVMGRNKASQGLASNPGQAMAGVICGALGVLLSVVLVIIGTMGNFGLGYL